MRPRCHVCGPSSAWMHGAGVCQRLLQPAEATQALWALGGELCSLCVCQEQLSTHSGQAGRLGWLLVWHSLDDLGRAEGRHTAIHGYTYARGGTGKAEIFSNNPSPHPSSLSLFFSLTKWINVLIGLWSKYESWVSLCMFNTSPRIKLSWKSTAECKTLARLNMCLMMYSPLFLCVLLPQIWRLRRFKQVNVRSSDLRAANTEKMIFNAEEVKPQISADFMHAADSWGRQDFTLLAGMGGTTWSGLFQQADRASCTVNHRVKTGGSLPIKCSPQQVTSTCPKM